MGKKEKQRRRRTLKSDARRITRGHLEREGRASHEDGLVRQREESPDGPSLEETRDPDSRRRARRSESESIILGVVGEGHGVGIDRPWGRGADRAPPHLGAAAGWGRPAGVLDPEDAKKFHALMGWQFDTLRKWCDVGAVVDAMLAGTWPEPVQRPKQFIEAILEMAFGREWTAEGEEIDRRKILGSESDFAGWEFLYFEVREQLAAVEQDARREALRIGRDAIRDWLGDASLPDVVPALPKGVIDRRRRPKHIRNLRDAEILALGGYARQAPPVGRLLARRR